MTKFRLHIIFILIFLAAALPFGARCEIVTQKQAMQLARQFFDIAYGETTAPPKMVYNGKRLTTDRLFTPFYVYNNPRGGFVIISAENKTFPILAYSLTSSLDADGLTESEKGWLQNYAHDIEMIRYDSRTPEEAISAWHDFKSYVKDLLAAPYISTDPTISIEEASNSINEILSLPDDSRDGEYSTYYTPEQWREMIDRQLSAEKQVALGYVDTRYRVYPGVAYGKKGDYYRIMFDRRNDWYVRLSAAEYLGDRLVARLNNPSYVSVDDDEVAAFEYYDSYAAEHSRNAYPSTSSLKEERMALTETQPIVKSVGAGHFDVILPEAPQLAMLYNLNGNHIGRATYGGSSNVAHINLEAEPRGFYFALIFGKNGHPYGVKLYR